MDNVEPASIDPKLLPEGFQAADPNGASSKDTAAMAQKQQIQEQRQAVLQQALTPDALERLNRIKLVKTEKAQQVENAIISMAMSGKLPGVINEGKLIEMLERGNAKEARNGGGSISIQRKKYAFDSDEEDNDDDL